MHIRTIDRRGGGRLNSLAGHATERDDMPYPADGMQHGRARSGRITRALSLMSTATVDGGLECHIQKIQRNWSASFEGFSIIAIHAFNGTSTELLA